ncbi:MAG: SigmaK-factor processing regulatory protein BofA [Methanoregulaceae archaeon PtaB.Bin009]|jgi:inhibitor of the pro-sigma K processing machinery|nr:MAG: SigmaK-factor processing regulatory protein BofA [Methanoregulaceae archaeon PtaB.Bin009]OPY41500.1 MAG: SigmaK-factor processing regulatory protein BofA [Methanoregulaceae archaeon PtaU1.Bin066]HNQ30300.1 pro-sigmaK processing inhibitor BofA family protein [Methanolinea sp.]
MNLDFAVLIAGIIIAVALFFLIKDITKLIINSILGLLILFFANLFNIMGSLGRTDIPYSLVNVLLCILGGIPGALIVIVLHLLGIEGF